MTEEFVTLETAKLLKKKGFNEHCTFAYADEDLRLIKMNSRNSYLDKIGEGYSAPTQSFAQKWLREIKGMHVEVSYMHGDYWTYDILTIPEHDLVGLSDRPLLRYKSYEEALEAGIQEALKLI